MLGAAVAVLALSIFARVASACPLAGQQGDIHARYDAALKVFQSSDQYGSIPMFQHLIDELGAEPQRLAPDLRAVLVRSLCFRARALFNRGDEAQAASDIRKALTFDPDVEIDRKLAARAFVDLFDKIVSAELGSVRVVVTPANAQVYLDGRPIQAGVARRVAPGSYVVRAEHESFDSVSIEITVAAGAQQTVPVKLKPAPRPVAPAPAPAPIIVPEPPRYTPDPAQEVPQVSPRGGPRRLMIRVDGALAKATADWSSSATFSLYGKTGYADTSYSSPKTGGSVGYEAGGWVRLFGPLIVGVSRAHSVVKFDARINYTVPDPRFNYTSRGLASDTTGITRTTDATHFDVGLTSGSPDFEFSVYGGLSKATITQAVITNGSFREDLGYLTLSSASYREYVLSGQSGWSAGGEVVWVFRGHFGFALSGRVSSYNVTLPDMGAGAFPVKANCVTFGGGLRVRY
jgi:hypothetical protein